MALTISWNNKPILQCANRVFSIFYMEIEKAIEKKKLNLNYHLRELIKDLDRCGDGVGLDIYEYIYTKKDLLQVIEILKEALSHLNHYEHYNHLKELYEALIQAYETFEPDPELLKSALEFDFYIENPEEFSAAITYNRKYLLVCPAEAFHLLFATHLPTILQENNIIPSDNLNQLVEDLQRNRTGTIDINYYTNSKEDVAFFADLMREVIDTIYKQYPEDTAYYAIFYEKFFNNLLETIDNFPYFTPEESKFTISEISYYKFKKRFADTDAGNNESIKQ